MTWVWIIATLTALWAVAALAFLVGSGLGRRRGWAEARRAMQPRHRLRTHVAARQRVRI